MHKLDLEAHIAHLDARAQVVCTKYPMAGVVCVPYWQKPWSAEQWQRYCKWLPRKKHCQHTAVPTPRSFTPYPTPRSTLSSYSTPAPEGWQNELTRAPTRSRFMAQLCQNHPLAGEACVPFWPKNRGTWGADMWFKMCQWRPHERHCQAQTPLPTPARLPTPAPTPRTPRPPPPQPPTSVPTLAPAPSWALLVPTTRSPLRPPPLPPLEAHWATKLCGARFTFVESKELCVDHSGKRKTYAPRHWQVDRARLRQQCHHNKLASAKCSSFWNEDSAAWTTANWLTFCTVMRQHGEPTPEGCAAVVTPGPTSLSPTPAAMRLASTPPTHAAARFALVVGQAKSVRPTDAVHDLAVTKACKKHPLLGRTCVRHWPRDRRRWDIDKWSKFCTWFPHTKDCLVRVAKHGGTYELAQRQQAYYMQPFAQQQTAAVRAMAPTQLPSDSLLASVPPAPVSVLPPTAVAGLPLAPELDSESFDSAATPLWKVRENTWHQQEGMRGDIP